MVARATDSFLPQGAFKVPASTCCCCVSPKRVSSRVASASGCGKPRKEAIKLLARATDPRPTTKAGAGYVVRHRVARTCHCCQRTASYVVPSMQPKLPSRPALKQPGKYDTGLGAPRKALSESSPDVLTNSQGAQKAVHGRAVSNRCCMTKSKAHRVIAERLHKAAVQPPFKHHPNTSAHPTWWHMMPHIIAAHDRRWAHQGRC
jgi:hypothetical protein